MSNNTDGETEVKEIYGELLMPATERLNLEFGYRYSDYDTAAGNVDTWKTLSTGRRPTRSAFAAATSQATRAPNTEEMFAGPSLEHGRRFVSGDPCQVHDDGAVGQSSRPTRTAWRLRDRSAALHRPERQSERRRSA